MKTYIENIHIEQAIKGIERLVAIPSYLQEPAENAAIWHACTTVFNRVFSSFQRRRL